MESVAHAQQFANLLLPGVGKSGTTSLFRYLSAHPEICGASVKETEYFSPVRWGRRPDPPQVYARYFAHCDRERYRLDATPQYCYGGAPMVAAIKDLVPQARAIIVLREPAERLWDSYWYMRSKLLLPDEGGFDGYLARCRALARTGDDTREEHRYHRLSTGRYDTWLPAWLEGFGPDLRVVFFDDLAADARGLVVRLLRWLGLDPAAAPPPEDVHNITLAHRSAALQSIAYRAAHGLRRWLRRTPRLHASLRGAYIRFNARPGGTPPLPAALRAEIAAEFADSNARTAALLRDAGYTSLPAWLAGASSTAGPPAAAGRGTDCST